MLDDCILIRIDKTKSTIFDFLRNDALQNNLVQLLKYLAESFDNLELQKTKKVAVFKTKIVQMWSLYYDLKGNCIKNLNLENIKFYTCTL